MARIVANNLKASNDFAAGTDLGALDRLRVRFL
jgi:hypothetical protein